jgi:lysylphosphatidylglycerol synthetase-like protein (DUF2156 family)
MDWLGLMLLATSLVWLALLSRRLGRVTHAPPYYIGLLAAAFLLLLAAVVRLVNDLNGVQVQTANAWWVAVYTGLPALAVTIALVFAWRYWSWLLAERD